MIISIEKEKAWTFPNLWKGWKLNPFLSPYTKVCSRWIKDLHVVSETIKTLEENLGNTILDVGISKKCHDRLQKHLQRKQNQRSGTKLIKELLHSKKKMINKQTSYWMKEFGNYTTDKCLISRIYKELQQISKPNTISLKNRQRHFGRLRQVDHKVKILRPPWSTW